MNYCDSVGSSSVMDQDGGNVTIGSGSFTAAPRFVTNVTSKLRYKEALRHWIKMMVTFGNAGQKMKAIFDGAGHIIYLSCDPTAQELLNRAERCEDLSLCASTDDHTKEKLIESILNFIAKESPTAAVRREVDMLTEIYSCQRRQDESVKLCNQIRLYCCKIFEPYRVVVDLDK